METKLRAVNRVTGRPIDLQANEAGEALVAMGGSRFEEITREGHAFHCQSETATAPVAAPGTTTCGFGIWNSAADGGRSIIIDMLFAANVTAGATLGNFSMMYVLGQTRVVALTGDLTIRKNNGMGPTTDSVALCEAGGAILDTVTGVVIGWLPIGPTVNAHVVSLFGMCLVAEVDGRIIVPPGRALGLEVIADTAAGTWNMGAMWHEKVITLA